MSKKLPNLASPFAKYRKQVEKYLNFSRITPRQKFWFGFVILCLLTTLLLNNPFFRSNGETYKEGDVIREAIVSPADISQTDDAETEKMRDSARNSVRPIFTFETNRADQAVQSFRSSWESLSRKADNANSKANTSNVNSTWKGAGGNEVGKVFVSRKYTTTEIDAITRILRENANGYVYNDSDEQFLTSDIIVVDRQKPNEQSAVSSPKMNMISLSTARDKLNKSLIEIKSLSPKEIDAFNNALSPLIQPSVIFDSVATNRDKEAATQNTQPITISLKRSQSIAKEGDIVTPQMLSQINAIRNYTSSSRQSNKFFGLLVLISALYWIAWKFIEHRGIVPRLTLSEEKTFALFGFVVLVQTFLMALFFRLAEFTAAQNVKAPYNDTTLWSFALPFAFGSLLITLLADRRTALFTGLFTSLLAGFLAPKSLEFIIYAAISSAVAVYGIGRYRTRQSVTLAGAFVGGLSALVAVALIGYMQLPFILNTILLAVGCGLFSGIITSSVTSVFLPICETMFGILTDVKLLELSNADLPVLGQLAMKAPGTNQHSHMVGTLTEEACRAVEANGLLARIGALYHDIGKLGAPEHFVENQQGKNPHDKLKPSQSSKIIVSHVTYGIKLGKEIGLPQRIIDFIPQHHGTRTLHFFLRKAQAELREGEEVDDNDFRYPGPKPQFKESAIMMIADSCEAAARSLENPNAENIRFIVTKIIDSILADDQLGECDLTLRELTQIRESLIKSLVAIHHSRVEYPGYVPPNSSMQKIIIPADLDSEERGMRYTNPADIPISKGGEIEDEAIDLSHQPNKEAKASTGR
jgi:cyclic-di-AMP phosphodiesterase PgpH